MIHSFYFRFYKITHCVWLSVILSKLAYFIYCVQFYFKKAFRKKTNINLDINEAYSMINSVNKNQDKSVEITRSDVNNDLDLSIIVPIYNYADLIKENIESILNQKTKYSYELILIDDGSTDGARDIVLSYSDVPNVKVICQENQGIAGARNTGLSIASGKYYMFVDCDDIVTDDIVETLLDKAYSDDCDMVMCAHNLVKEKEGIITSILPNIYSGKNLSNYSKNAEILNYAGLPWCKVYKRELWENVRFYKGYWYEDVIIHSLIFTKCKKFAYVPKCCYQYRWYEKNFSHIQGKSKNPKSIDIYWLMNNVCEKLYAEGIENKECFYTMLLTHLSLYYYSKVEFLDKELVEALFIAACDLYEKYKIEDKIHLPYMLKMVEKSLKNKDIELWKLASKYQ